MKVAMMGAFPVFRYKDKLKIIGDMPTNTTSWNVNLAKELAQMQDTEVHFLNLCTHIKKSKVVVDEGVIIHFIKVIPKLGLLSFFQYYKHKIKSILHEINPDIVNGIGFEHIYPFLAVTSGYPSVISVGPVLKDFLKIADLEARRLIKYWILKQYERYTLRRSEHIIVRTPFTIESLKNDTPGKFYVVENCVERIFFNSSDSTYNRNNADSSQRGRLIFIGRMAPEKDLLTLVKSLKLIKDDYENEVILKIVGNLSEINKYFKRIVDKINNLKLNNNVNFLGFKSRTEVVKEIKNSDVLVLPSLYESFGMVLAEAIALGVPVVASDAAAIPHLISDGETGFLVEPGNSEAFAKKIITLLKNKELRKKMGKKGRQEAKKRFRPEIMAKKTRAVYEKVLSDWDEK